MKKSISVILIVILMISFSGCKKDINNEINKIYRDLQSYTAKVNVTVVGNKGTEEYEMFQIFSGGRYRVEITKPERMKGTVVVLSDDEMWLQGAGEPAIYMKKGFSEEERDYMFIRDFLDEYYSGESLPALISDENGRIMMNLQSNGKNERRFNQCLWIDERSKLPVCLVTCDKNGEEVVRVEYISFNYKAEIDESVFVL